MFRFFRAVRKDLIERGKLRRYLGIISSQAIKGSLMDLDLLYEKMKEDEDHMRFDLSR